MKAVERITIYEEICPANDVGPEPKTSDGKPKPGTEKKAKSEKSPSRQPPRPRALWHTPNGEPWATLDNRQHWPVKSEQFREWLAGQFYLEGAAAGRAEIDKTIEAFAAEARFDGSEHRIHLRFAENEENGIKVIWLDLADKEGRSVRIDANGWTIVPARDVPVKFSRPPNMRALPEPLADEAQIVLLDELLNVRDEDTRNLVATWLSFALVPEQRYPVIGVSGPPGSAKTSLSQTLRNLIDPSSVALLGVPQGRDLVAQARNNAVLGFDNLSRVSPYLSDDLCRLATGGGLGGRKLYTNADDATFSASRPIILNGINDLATRGDLADRSLVLRLPKLEKHERRTATELQKVFDYAHPRVLAAILDMVVLGLRRGDEVLMGRPELPRMADFAAWGWAVAPALGWTKGDFDRAYQANCDLAFAAAIEDDAVAPYLMEFLEQRSGKTWEGTTKELRQKLIERLPGKFIPSGFPQSHVALGKFLNRIEPALTAFGVTVERLGHTRRGSALRLTMA